MPTDRSFQAANARSRQRLRTLVARLADADLQRPVAHGWTVADSLVHLAFWDLRAVELIDRFQHEGARPSPVDVDVVNDAVRALGRAIPPHAAARLAVEAAEAADGRIEAMPDALVDAVPAAGHPFDLTRHVHRNGHLEEIERAVA